MTRTTRARWHRSAAIVLLGALLAACATDSSTPVPTVPGGPSSNGPIGMSASSMDGNVGSPYINGDGMTLSVLGSNPGTPYFWTVDGQIPPGLALTPADDNTLSSTLRISGTPTTGGPFSILVSVHASDHSPLISAVPFLINIGGGTVGPPAVTRLSFTWTKNKPYLQALLASGGTLPYFSWSAGPGLPPGIALDPKEGTLSGTPTTAGTYEFAVTVTDSTGRQGTDTITVTVVSDGLETGASTLNGTVNIQYSVTFSVAESAAETMFYWTVSGALPPGLTVTPTNNFTLSNTLLLSGTPTIAGQFPLEITVHASDHSLLIPATPKSIRIAGAVVGSPVVTALQFTWVVDLPGQQFLGATGGQLPYTTWSAASLPPGVTLNQTNGDGSLSGTVTTAGTYSIDVTVTDSAGQQGTGTVTLTVISLAPYEGSWTGFVLGGPHAGKRLSLFLDQAGKASQGTLGDGILATPSAPLQFTYVTAPPTFVGLNASLSQFNWHLVCNLNAGSLECIGHAASDSEAENGRVALTRLGSGTLDSVPPTKVSSTPADGATGVTATQVTVVFSELMSGTGGVGAITLSGGSVGVPSYAGTANDVAGQTLVIPLSGLQSDTLYTLTLNPAGLPAGTGLRDLAGNPLATTSIGFRTAAVVVNSPPTADPASYTAVIGTPKAITLTGSDPEDGAPTSYTVATLPAAGNLTPSGTTATGNRTYTPTVAGPYSFTFYVTDSLGAQSPLATVNITVQQPPVAVAQNLNTPQNTALPITLAGEAETGFTITAWTIVSGPSNGVVTPGSGSSRTYTPNASFTGPDSFTFRVTDSRGLESAPATVAITVSAVGNVTAFNQAILIRKRTESLASTQEPLHWAIFLTGSPEAVRFKIVPPWPQFADTGTGPGAWGYNFVAGKSYAINYDEVAKTHETIMAQTTSMVDTTTGNITVTPAGSPYVVAYTVISCHVTTVWQDFIHFVAIDANGAESAPATVTINVSQRSSCPH